MSILKIIDFQKRPLGTIAQGKDGQLQLQVIEEQFRGDLENLTRRIAAQPVYLTFGGVEQKDGKAVRVTKRKIVKPTDDEFLAGVQELLNKTAFGETRIRGLVIKETKP